MPLICRGIVDRFDENKTYHLPKGDPNKPTVLEPFRNGRFNDSRTYVYDPAPEWPESLLPEEAETVQEWVDHQSTQFAQAGEVKEEEPDPTFQPSPEACWDADEGDGSASVEEPGGAGSSSGGRQLSPDTEERQSLLEPLMRMLSRSHLRVPLPQPASLEPLLRKDPVAAEDGDSTSAKNILP